MRSWLLVAALGGCSAPTSSTSTPVAPAPVPVVSDVASAQASSGKHVDVHGEAGNAKLGAVITANAGLVVYCRGTDSWPDAMVGKPVVASGLLEQSNEFAAPPGSNAEVSAGTDGPVWVLRGCTFAH